MSTENNLWMGDIKPWMDEPFILRAFNFYNINPLSVKLIHDRNTNELKNFCFINFETVEEANKCLIMLNGKQIPNTPTNMSIKFKLNWANYFSSFNKSVYVGNLSPEVDDISLYNLFKERYSSVHHASVITDKGKSKGYGFILFRGEKDYEKCLTEMNGVLFHGNIIKVNEQRKKDDDVKSNNYNSNDNNNDNNYNLNVNTNNSHHHHQNKKTRNNEQNLLNNIYNLNKHNKIKYNNNNINSQLSNNINNINNYQTDVNSLMHKNNSPNIINNIINIHNNNNINNINYINDINSNIFGKNQLINNNNLNFNQNSINNSLNNSINRSILDMSNNPTLYSNNNYLNNSNENESNFINSNNQIINNINSINNVNNINNYNKNTKKDSSIEYNLEILNNYDNTTLKKKIRENLEKMYNYYMDIYPGDLNKLRCKL